MSKADARQGRGQDPEEQTEPVQAYEDLLQLNQGFEQVLNSLHRAPAAGISTSPGG